MKGTLTQCGLFAALLILTLAAGCGDDEGPGGDDDSGPSCEGVCGLLDFCADEAGVPHSSYEVCFEWCEETPDADKDKQQVFRCFESYPDCESFRDCLIDE